MTKKGFTLIELLVVIAIIGILASIVLVTFPGARDKAKDARIISAVAQMRTEMISYYNDQSPNTYVGFNDGSSAEMTSLDADVTAQGGGMVYTAMSADAGCIYTPINDGTDQFYCADSTGVAVQTACSPAMAGGCSLADASYDCTFTCAP